MGIFFKVVNDHPKYYAFASNNDNLLNVWLKGFALVKERAIGKLPPEGGASKKRTTRTRRPLRRKSGTKRLRRRRSNRRSRTARK